MISFRSVGGAILYVFVSIEVGRFVYGVCSEKSRWSKEKPDRRSGVGAERGPWWGDLQVYTDRMRYHVPLASQGIKMAK